MTMIETKTSKLHNDLYQWNKIKTRRTDVLCEFRRLNAPQIVIDRQSRLVGEAAQRCVDIELEITLSC